MLGVLLSKDLCRAWRNPLPKLLNIAIPLCLAALIGLMFGGDTEQRVEHVRLGVVNEDHSNMAVNFLRDAVNRGGKRFELVLLDRSTALREIQNNRLSAVVIIPENFADDYQKTHPGATLELIKNPAQSVYPAILEELMNTIVTGLNATARNRLDPEQWPANLSGESGRGGGVINDDAAPVIGYEKQSLANEAGKVRNMSGSDVLAYVLIGLAAMSLLFMAGNSMFDLTRELQQQTFRRYHSLNHNIVPFLASKIAFVMAMLVFGSIGILGGGGWVFHIHWQHPLALAVLLLCYACFAAALMTLLVALVPDERQASSLSSMITWTLVLVGGCIFPARQLPGFLRDRLTAQMPTFWFTNAARGLQLGGTDDDWKPAAIKMAIVGAVLVLVAAMLFRRRFKLGLLQ